MNLTDQILMMFLCVFFDWILYTIYITHVVFKVCYYSCLLLCITSFSLSPHGPHTVCSEHDERQWVIDAHRASSHLLLLLGGSFEGCPAPFRGAGVWEAAVGTRLGNSATLKLGFHQHYIILWPFSPAASNSPEARPVYRDGQ